MNLTLMMPFIVIFLVLANAHIFIVCILPYSLMSYNDNFCSPEEIYVNFFFKCKDQTSFLLQPLLYSSGNKQKKSSISIYWKR